MRSIVPFLLLLTLTKAFETSLISGRYTLSAGSCPSPLAILSNSTTLSPNTIFLKNIPCNISITLTSSPSNKTALHIFLSGTPQIGSFLTTSQNLTCGNHTIHSLTLFYTTTQLTLPSGLMPALKAQDPVLLKEGFVYLLTNKCVFQREKPDEDNVLEKILNTVTECLPGDALVTTSTGLKQVNKLSDTDKVTTSAGLQPVLTWTHREREIVTSFTQIRFGASNYSLELTSGHYVFTDRGLLPAGSVRVGMVMESDTKPLVVRSVGNVVKRGVYNPHTAAGDLLVGMDRVRVSCYTSAVQPVVAHALLIPVRSVYFVDGAWTGWVGKAVEALVDRFRYSEIVGWFSG